MILVATLTTSISAMGLGPAHDEWPYSHLNQGNYQVRVVNDGIASLALRLHMLDRAKATVDYMTFTFRLDRSGRLLLHSMMNQAVSGKHVRLLLDYYGMIGHPEITDQLANAVKKNLKARQATGSFEIRYYNRRGLLPDLGKMNHRNHIKMFVIDSSEILTGGRNSNDEYFQLETRNVSFIDREFWIRDLGNKSHNNVAAQGSAAFETYWNDSKWVQGVDQDDDGGSEANEAIAVQSDEGLLRNSVESAALPVLGQDEAATDRMPILKAHAISLVLDRQRHGHVDRLVAPFIAEEFKLSTTYLLIENYSAALTGEMRGIFENLIAKNKTPIVLLTNGFATTVDLFLTNLSERAIGGFVNEKATTLWAFEVAGAPMPGQLSLDGNPMPKYFADHTKSFVVYGHGVSDAGVGSYDLDPRSENLNNEILVVVHDSPGVSGAVSQNILERLHGAEQLTPDASTSHLVSAGRLPNRERSTFLGGVVHFLHLDRVVSTVY